MLARTILYSAILTLGTGGCAILHSVQLGDIESKTVLSGQPFEIKLNEIGINTAEAVDIAEAIAKTSGYGNEVSAIGDIIELFQMGPRTGNPVFKVDYSDQIAERILQECPSGQVTGLMAIRETAKYPVISGEIVRLIGYCS